MIFTEPCCTVLKQCLEPLTGVLFYRAGGKVGPLMVRTGFSFHLEKGVLQPQALEQAVIFCPFCGKQLRTSEDVERYFKGALQ